MTTDEFERIIVAASQMRSLTMDRKVYVPLEGIIKIILSQLHGEDRGLYQFDFVNNKWQKNYPAPPA